MIYFLVIVLFVIVAGLFIMNWQMGSALHALAEAQRYQAQAVMADAVGRLAIVLVVCAAILAVGVCAGLVLRERMRSTEARRRTEGRVQGRVDTEARIGSGIAAPQLPAGNAMEQLIQLEVLKMMREERRREEVIER